MSSKPFVGLLHERSEIERREMEKLRLHITMSLDGYVAGPGQDEENPLGVGGLELHEWVFSLKEFREMHGGEGGIPCAASLARASADATPSVTNSKMVPP